MRLSNRNSIHSLMLVLSLCANCLMALPATAMAYPPSNNTVYSVRSFPATTTTRRDLTRESVSTDVQSDSDWGGIENLIVPQTKSQAEKRKPNRKRRPANRHRNRRHDKPKREPPKRKKPIEARNEPSSLPQHPKPDKPWQNMRCSSADTHTCTAATSHQAGIVPDSSNTCSRNSVSVSPTSQAVK